MSQQNICCDAYKPEQVMDTRSEQSVSTWGKKKKACPTLTAVKFKQQQDRKVVEKGAVQYERHERSQPAVSRRGRRLDPVGVHLTQNFKQSSKERTWWGSRGFKMWLFMKWTPSRLTRVRHFQRSIKTVHQFLRHVQPGTQENEVSRNYTLTTNEQLTI